MPIETELMTLSRADLFLNEAQLNPESEENFGSYDHITLQRASDLIKECFEIDQEISSEGEDLSITNDTINRIGGNLERASSNLVIYALAKKAKPAKYLKNFDTVAQDISERVLNIKDKMENVLVEMSAGEAVKVVS